MGGVGMKIRAPDIPKSLGDLGDPSDLGDEPLLPPVPVAQTAGVVPVEEPESLEEKGDFEEPPMTVPRFLGPVFPMNPHSTISDLSPTRPSLSERVCSEGERVMQTLESPAVPTEEDKQTCADLRVLVTTWNLGGTMPGEALGSLIGTQMDAHPNLIVLCLQETVNERDRKELNCLNCLCDFEDREKREKERELERWVKAGFREGDGDSEKYKKVEEVSMVGLHLLIFAKDETVNLVRDVKADFVKTGWYGALGNKGAVRVRLLLGEQSLCFLNVHLPSGQNAAEERLAAFRRIWEEKIKIGVTTGGERNCSDVAVSSHDVVILGGDFNFRRLPKQKGSWNSEALYGCDEFDTLQRTKYPFSTVTEFSRTFAPTYKYKKNIQPPRGAPITETLDLSRDPSWTDRVLFRGQAATCVHYQSHPEFHCSDHKPVSALFRVQTTQRAPAPPSPPNSLPSPPDRTGMPFPCLPVSSVSLPVHEGDPGPGPLPETAVENEGANEDEGTDPSFPFPEGGEIESDFFSEKASTVCPNAESTVCPSDVWTDSFSDGSLDSSESDESFRFALTESVDHENTNSESSEATSGDLLEEEERLLSSFHLSLDVLSDTTERSPQNQFPSGSTSPICVERMEERASTAPEDVRFPSVSHDVEQFSGQMNVLVQQQVRTPQSPVTLSPEEEEREGTVKMGRKEMGPDSAFNLWEGGEGSHRDATAGKGQFVDGKSSPTWTTESLNESSLKKDTAESVDRASIGSPQKCPKPKRPRGMFVGLRRSSGPGAEVTKAPLETVGDSNGVTADGQAQAPSAIPLRLVTQKRSKPKSSRSSSFGIGLMQALRLQLSHGRERRTRWSFTSTQMASPSTNPLTSTFPEVKTAAPKKEETFSDQKEIETPTTPLNTEGRHSASPGEQRLPMWMRALFGSAGKRQQ
uniref:Inositol polyphosphate-related phosphatase domain-containing protein n=1 Tax=Chromera velia CCMP2878 TaxID=1169474 RepID=A0A0G4IDV9_9ALVE|eukprot:Cvel_2365.t1-p1 / transcript=Cvel_2365.t1 / gene=Cvel_2365 / organism=Chromera_velia_CCMP2878 / gene_product=Type II inositol 1,4,5-trisphosphate 5-phosphatase, putative / transcript_product=Type II inositol 1,4,5-trisphosphate 5-phosphatase, putative / location=Cvel_scaffold92:8694-14313(-) / protein_length=919 / sequence_SO=supercontig / SO=protein_coding / is_pseudo=false